MKRLLSKTPSKLPFVLILILASCGMLALSSCGKFFGPLPVTTCTTDCSSTTDYLYVANSETSTPTVAASVEAFSLTNGTLTAATGSPFSLSGLVPTALTVNRSDTFLYVADITGGIYLYAINSGGSLTIQNGSAAVIPSIIAQSMQVDATGGWLLVANAALPSITGYPIDPTTGLLTTATAVQLSLNGGTGTTAGMTIAPNNNFVYVSLGTAGVEIVNFSATAGTLTDAGNLPTYGSTHGSAQNFDQGLAINPAGTYLFITESGANGVLVASINQTTGALTVSTAPVPTGLGPSAVLVDSTGSYVYVTNRTANTISAFVLTNAGSLTTITGSPFTTGTSPIGIVEDSSNTYVAVLCQGGAPDLQLFSFDTTTPGALDSFTTTATGTDPTVAIAIAASH